MEQVTEERRRVMYFGKPNGQNSTSVCSGYSEKTGWRVGTTQLLWKIAFYPSPLSSLNAGRIGPARRRSIT